MWFVYILRCADESFYVGETHDVPTRLAAHNKGCASSHTLKRWSRAKKEALIAGDKAALKKL